MAPRSARPRALVLALLLFAPPLLLASAGLAEPGAPGEVPLDDLLQVVVLDHDVLVLDARGGSGPQIRLEIGEEVVSHESRGQVAVALTNRRMLAVGADSGAWQEARYRADETMLEGPLLGDRVVLLLTNLRALGFDGRSGNLVERTLGPQERIVARAVGSNVAVAATARRAFGLSPFAGGFFEAKLQAGEVLEAVEAAANLATLTTSRRLLTFRAPTGAWSERRLGIGN